MSQSNNIDQRLDVLATRPFRAKFHLQESDRLMIAQKGLDTIRQHAADLIGKRLAPAAPLRNGKQTPYRGHPVFVAQHATATCCRSCLERWHRIPKGRELTPTERDYVVAVIEAWLLRELCYD